MKQVLIHQKFAKKTDLASLKSDIDKLDIDELETTPADLSKLSDGVKNEVVKKVEYNELVKDLNTIQSTDTSNLVKKNDYDTKIGEVENKIDHDHGKNITTQELNKLTVHNFAAKLAQAKLATKADIADFVKELHFDDKLNNIIKKAALNKTKYTLVENKINKFKKINKIKHLNQFQRKD